MKEVTRNDAIEAIKIILRWIGEDPTREGLHDTPERVIKSYEEHFSGYNADLQKIFNVSFSEIANYQDLIILKDIMFESFCEHHMAPIIGHVHIAYIPNKKVIGISKLARVVEVFAKRLQIQERMTAQIAYAIFSKVEPLGVSVIVDGEHHCMTTRGVKSHQSKMRTQTSLGNLKTNPEEMKKFMDSIIRP